MTYISCPLFFMPLMSVFDCWQMYFKTVNPST